MATPAIMIFTSQNPQTVLDFGGSQSWRLDERRARLCKYVILTQNRAVMDFPESQPTEPHGDAFMIGRIAGVVPSTYPGSERRFLIQFDEYAVIKCSGCVVDFWIAKSIKPGQIKAEKWKEVSERALDWVATLARTTRKELEENAGGAA